MYSMMTIATNSSLKAITTITTGLGPFGFGVEQIRFSPNFTTVLLRKLRKDVGCTPLFSAYIFTLRH